MQQTRKRNPCYFGTKLVGLNDGFGIIHAFKVTAVSERELNPVGACFMPQRGAHSDYRGINKRKEHQYRNLDWSIARRPGVTCGVPEGSNLLVRKGSKSVFGRR